MAKKLKDELKKPLTDEEMKIHVDRVLDARKDVVETKATLDKKTGIYRSAMKAAGKAGISKDALADAIREAEMDAVTRAAHLAQMGRIMRIMGAPLGTQFELFAGVQGQTQQEAANAETPSDSVDPAQRLATAFAQGMEAGWGGNNKDRNPYAADDEARAEWDRGWDEGQSKAVTERLTPRRRAA